MFSRLFPARVTAFYRAHGTFLVAAFLGVAYFLIQFASIDAYGATWDEPLHRNWGKVFALFSHTHDRNVLVMMPGHGIYYGPLYFFINFRLSEWIYHAHWMSFTASNHVLNLAVASLAVGLTYVFASGIAGRRVGLLAVVFFALFPQLVAHAHYNPKDIPLMTAVLASACMLQRAFRSGHRRSFALAGLTLGFGMAVKIIALLMLPAFGLAYLVWLLCDRHADLRDRAVLRRESFTLVLTACLIALGMYLAWPSAWGDPSLIARSFHFFLQTDFWPGKVMFFSTEYAGADLPWYYTPFEYLAAMPVLTIVSLGMGVTLAVRRLARKEIRTFDVLLLMWLLIPLLLSMKPGLVRYDGMRQFYFCLPAAAVLAATGFDAFLAFLGRKTAKPLLTVSVAVLLLLGSLVREVALLHPFEGSYRNEIMRTFFPHDMDQSFQIEYWGATYKQGIDWLIENADENPVICVPTAGVLVTWYQWREDFRFECSAASTYIMFFTRYSEAKQLADSAIPPVFVVRRMNSDLLRIYKIGTSH